MKQKNSVQVYLSQLPYYRWLIFASVAEGTFMSSLSASSVNVALPTITRALETDVGTVQWIITAFLLITTSMLPLAGRLGDLFGRKKVFCIGFIGFMFGSALCSLASTIFTLVLARMVQAFGGAALMANSFALITDNFPKNERGRVLGTIGAVVGVGTMTGPAMGGALLSILDWHAIFYINVPLALLGFLAVYFILPPDAVTDNQEKSIDYKGAAYFAIMMCSFLSALSFGAKLGWMSLEITSLFLLSIVFFMLFIRQEKRILHPMLDLQLFSNKPFALGNISGSLSFVALFSNIMMMPFFLHDIQHMSPGQIGTIMSIYSVFMFAIAPLSGVLSDKIGPYALTTTGLGFMAVGIYFSAELSSSSALLEIIFAQGLIGIGNGLFQSPNNSSVMGAVHPSKMGVAGGINALSRNLGMVCGTALAVAIFEYRRQGFLAGTSAPSAQDISTAFMAGYHDALLAGVGYAVLALLISLSRKGYVEGGKEA
ncbi:MAG: MFS transporter [Pelosinus sp.]|nr:MFS transporter [Pelosinus sp.]